MEAMSEARAQHMTDLEKAEKWLGISFRTIRHSIDTRLLAQQHDEETVIDSIVQQVLIALHQHRVRMYTAQRSRSRS